MKLLVTLPIPRMLAMLILLNTTAPSRGLLPRVLHLRVPVSSGLTTHLRRRLPTLGLGLTTVVLRLRLRLIIRRSVLTTRLTSLRRRRLTFGYTTIRLPHPPMTLTTRLGFLLHLHHLSIGLTTLLSRRLRTGPTVSSLIPLPPRRARCPREVLPTTTLRSSTRSMPPCPLCSRITLWR